MSEGLSKSGERSKLTLPPDQERNANVFIFRMDVLDTLDRTLCYLVCNEETREIVYITRAMELMFGSVKVNGLIGTNVDSLIKQPELFHSNGRTNCVGVGVEVNMQKLDGIPFQAIATVFSAVITGKSRQVVLVLEKK